MIHKNSRSKLIILSGKESTDFNRLLLGNKIQNTETVEKEIC